MIQITNEEFLQTCFGDDHIWAHCCSFHDDPSDISGERRFRCWGGNYYSRTSLIPNSNQYYTISTFMADDSNKARRRKSLFRATHVIVADDVREKLPIEEVNKLPAPTFKLQTSPGSEQWGWVLDVPCTDRHRVENLLDGLVAQGLAPQGKDPGMKGVTRYVRLPNGVNTKKSKLVNGQPVPCRLLEWHPSRKVTIEALAQPFRVDLDAERREGRVDGAADVDGHPLLQLEDIIEIKSVRSAGRFDITCPWVEEHTKQADDGAAVFTNSDGSIGFKCHHGACQNRTGRDLLELIEESHPGFKERLSTWQVMRTFGADESVGTEPVVAPAPPLDFMGVTAVSQQELDFMGTKLAEEAPVESLGYQDLIDRLKRTMPHSVQRTELAYKILQAVDQLDHGNRLIWWEQIRDTMEWKQKDFDAVLQQQREIWYQATAQDDSFFDGHLYVAEQNAFFHPIKRMWLTPDGFQNNHSHLNDEARMSALVEGRCEKVDRIDYFPGHPEIFVDMGIRYGNVWRPDTLNTGVKGDVFRWLEHFRALGWGEHIDHLLKFMAFTIRNPSRKINHMLILGGGQGTGKDFLLYPLMMAMGRDSVTVNGSDLLSDFNDFLFGVKHLHVNETELGDRKEANAVTNKLKGVATAPPHTIRCNPKGVKGFPIRNIVNTTMTTNSCKPLNLSMDSRRYYGVWTDVSIRNQGTGQVEEDWRTYWDDRWNWMRDQQGWKACAHHLFSEVDLSDFDPGASPLVTDFVKDIQEASEDPLVTIIKDLIYRKVGMMQSDLVTSRDIERTLRLANRVDYDLKGIPGPGSIGRIMKQNRLGLDKKCWDSTGTKRLWVLRSHSDYSMLSGGALHDQYIKQINAVRNSGAHLSVVEGQREQS